MPNKLYDNYVERLSRLFVAELATIKVVYNFDLGEEFEIALCRVLRKILPTRFGLCRGFVMDLDGNIAGDDIIIFDKNRFPTIGLRDEDDFSRKEFIPVEAVYMYIEAKYTLNLSGADGQSLIKAIDQVNEVKSVCNHRKPVEVEEMDEVRIEGVKVPWDHPPIKNPAWGAIICSRIRIEDKIIEDPHIINAILKTKEITTEFRPDLLVVGKSVLSIPIFQNQPKMGTDTPSFFSINGMTSYRTFITKNMATGIGIAQILGALDRIRLGKIRWNYIVYNALQ